MTTFVFAFLIGCGNVWAGYRWGVTSERIRAWKERQR